MSYARSGAIACMLASLSGCARETPDIVGRGRDAGTSTAHTAVHPLHPIVVTPTGTSQGPWRARGSEGAAASPALLIDGVAYSGLAYPEESLARADLQWVRWGSDGVTTIDHRQTTGMPPGAAMALVSRGVTGAVLVWIAGPRDGGEGDARALEVGPHGFVGDERAAGASEASGVQWIRDVMARRPRERVDEPPPVLSSQSALVSVDLHRGAAIVSTGGVEITRGEDLLGYERSIAASEADGTRWVAVSRGRCVDARVEVFRIAGGVPTLRAMLSIGAEVGVRWLTVDAHGTNAAVTWYQDRIPLRLECARGAHAPGITDHGVRVATVAGGA